VIVVVVRGKSCSIIKAQRGLCFNFDLGGCICRELGHLQK
jgi:hypothetical protein